VARNGLLIGMSEARVSFQRLIEILRMKADRRLDSRPCSEKGIACPYGNVLAVSVFPQRKDGGAGPVLGDVFPAT